MKNLYTLKRIIFLFLIILNTTFALNSSSVKLCKFEDVECIKDSMNDVISRSGNGFSELNIPRIEPFYYKGVNFTKESVNAVNFNLFLKDLEIYGLSKLKVYKVVGFTSDPSTSKFEFYGRLAKLNIKGIYKSSGRILILPINGEGPFNQTYEDIDFSVKIKPVIISKKNGKHYLAASKVKCLFEPKLFRVHLDNLFDGNKVLGDNMNKFLNENWKDVWQEFESSVNEVMSNALKEITNKFLQVGTYEDLFQN